FHYFTHDLRPIRLCDNSMATCSPASKADASPALTSSPTLRGSSARMTVMPISSSACCVALPMGPCQGLNSAYSPRMVTSVRNGNRQLPSSENMLTQLPTPLLCISSTALCPPSQAPQLSATPSSSVVSATSIMSGSACAFLITSACPASGTYETCLTCARLSSSKMAACHCGCTSLSVPSMLVPSTMYPVLILTFDRYRFKIEFCDHSIVIFDGTRDGPETIKSPGHDCRNGKHDACSRRAQYRAASPVTADQHAGRRIGRHPV